MPTTRTAKTHWEGTLAEGAGKVSLESSGVGTFDVSWPSRAEEANGKTSPEELIAAIDRYVATWNEHAHPFTWTKTADQILAKAIKQQPTSGTEH